MLPDMHRESVVLHVVAAHWVVLVIAEVPHLGSVTVSSLPRATHP